MYVYISIYVVYICMCICAYILVIIHYISNEHPLYVRSVYYIQVRRQGGELIGQRIMSQKLRALNSTNTNPNPSTDADVSGSSTDTQTHLQQQQQKEHADTTANSNNDSSSTNTTTAPRTTSLPLRQMSLEDFIEAAHIDEVLIDVYSKDAHTKLFTLFQHIELIYSKEINIYEKYYDEKKISDRIISVINKEVAKMFDNPNF